MAEGFAKVRTKTDRKRTMGMNAVGIIDEARKRAAFLVEKDVEQTGSRMMSYERIASAVGTTGGWLRKFIGRQPDVRPDLVVGHNIYQLYSLWCSRVEDRVKRVREEVAELEQLHDATFESVFESDLSALRAEADAEPR